MADLWSLFRTAWPGSLPTSKPLDVTVEKHTLRFQQRLTAWRPGCLAVVISGQLSERMYPDDERECIVRSYLPREPIYSVVGRLRAERRCDLVMLAPGWEPALPGAVALVDMLAKAEMNGLKRRLAEMMCLPATERVRKFVSEHGLVPSIASRQHIAHSVGCSREVVSRVLKEMEARP